MVTKKRHPRYYYFKSKAKAQEFARDKNSKAKQRKEKKHFTVQPNAAGGYTVYALYRD